MTFKTIALAAIGLTMLTGSAFAESNIHGSSSGTTEAFTSGAMEDDYAATHGHADARSSLPQSEREGATALARADAYGYAAAPAPRHVVTIKHHR
jgi:hypothetical protein